MAILTKEECLQGFKGMNDKQLAKAFNKEVMNPGWTSSRAVYLAALAEEFNSRKFDYSLIGGRNMLSFKNKIKIIGKKIAIDN